MRIDYHNIEIGTIQDSHLEKCVEVREKQSGFFFQPVNSRKASLQWIRNHREGRKDVIFEIHHRKTGTFLGTIGMVRRGNAVEIGRLAIYTPGVYALLKRGMGREEIGEIGLDACIAMICFAFEEEEIASVFARVRGDNELINRLCMTQCEQIEEDDGARIYCMSRQQAMEKYKNEEVAIFSA